MKLYMIQDMISIVIPLYNKKECISKAIQSTLNQTYTNWELIIVDDGSTDNSADVVKPYLYDPRITYIYRTNKGVSSARNLGIKKSSGKWIILLDADDYFLPNALELLLRIAKKYNTCISSGNFIIKESKKEVIFCKGRKEGIINNNFRSWFFTTFFPRTGAALFHNSVLKNHLFDESLHRFEDAKSLFEIFKLYKIAYSPESVMVYSLDNTTLSKKSTDVKKDFIFKIDFTHKSFWEKISLSELVLQGYKLYPEYSKLLDYKYKKHIHWLKITQVFLLLKKINNKISKIHDCYKKIY